MRKLNNKVIIIIIINTLLSYPAAEPLLKYHKVNRAP